MMEALSDTAYKDMHIHSHMIIDCILHAIPLLIYSSRLQKHSAKLILYPFHLKVILLFCKKHNIYKKGPIASSLRLH